MKSPTPLSRLRHPHLGFTLIELLTVISVIAILSGILIPVVSTALVSVRKSKTLSQLNNLATVCKQYKNEYKIWPTLESPAPTDPDHEMKLKDLGARFINVMSAYDVGGDKALSEDDRQYNRRAIPFANFSDYDMNPQATAVVDAFLNDDIRIIVDNDGNNQIAKVSVTMSSVEGRPIHVQQDKPIHSDIIVMSPGHGINNSDAVTTWELRE